MPSLQQDSGLWRLTFQGRSAVLKHELGLLYVAYLLTHPQPIHAVALFRQVRGGGSAAPSQLQQRSLALDRLDSMRELWKRQRQLEALLDDQAETEPVKAEALRELEAIMTYRRQHNRREDDQAQKIVRSVRRAIRRLHARLLAATDGAGRPHPALRPFGVHLGHHLLRPSGSGSPAGTFAYEPPPGVRWN